MIRNIPEKDEFLQFGFEYIHLAYEGVLNLVQALQKYDPDREYLDTGEKEEYWENAKGKLMIYERWNENRYITNSRERFVQRLGPTTT